MTTTVSNPRFLESLELDYQRLLELAERSDLSAKVPSCPEWTLDDLVEHVAMVYLHKVETMQRGEFPAQWPPPRGSESSAQLLERCYAALRQEFSQRVPADHTPTWYEPDQTVGFWIRRMAHETVIHRVDAELAAGVPIAPIPDDIAVDGIDEILATCLAYASVAWPEAFEGTLPESEETVLVRSGESAWLVTLGDRITVVNAPADAVADATVEADPTGLLLWAWRRSGADTVSSQGRADVAAKLGEVLRIAGQ
jgi:uncharacterized protein (TIGR03083 family)